MGNVGKQDLLHTIKHWPPHSLAKQDVFKPMHDQKTLSGRLRHFVEATNPATVFVPDQQLIEAKQTLIKYSNSPHAITVTGAAELRRANGLYHAAFHPDTGEITPRAGRMAFQVFGGTALTAGMLLFRSTPAVVFWQLMNQAAAAYTNYANRSASSNISNRDIGVACSAATVTAIFTAMRLQAAIAASRMKFLQRFVPFAAVMSAHAVSIPLIRHQEWRNGITVKDDIGRAIGVSQLAAVKSMGLVWLSRAVLNAGMCIVPNVVCRLEKAKVRPSVLFVSQLALVASALLVTTPLACALFPQEGSISAKALKMVDSKLSLVLQEHAHRHHQLLYFSKGL